MANNRHGLDANYHREKLNQLIRDIDNYTPEEYARALCRLVVASEPLMFSETEFNKARIDSAFNAWCEK